MPDLLAGREVAGAERVQGRGIAGGVRAAVRCDSAPAPGSGSWVDRWARLGRDRPAGYRIANGVSALALFVVAWVQVGDGRVGFGVLAAVLGLSSLVEVRPPRRGDRSAERPPAEVAPTG